MNLAKILIISIVLTSCSSHMINIEYQSTGNISSDTGLPKISIGGVVDSRGTDSNWLGAIRGGYGNPIKKLYSTSPTSEAISDAFEQALRARNLYDILGAAPFRLDITVNKFDTSYYFNKEAHADFTIDLVAFSTGTSVFKQSYKTDNVQGGAGAGIFGDADALGEFAVQTLNQTIDKVLEDPRFLLALNSSPATSGNPDTADRLKELQSLKDQGLITEEEFSEQRAKILMEL